VFCVQCSDLSRMIDSNKDGLDQNGYDSASKVWSGVEIVAQFDMIGLTAEKFKKLQVSVKLFEYFL